MCAFSQRRAVDGAAVRPPFPKGGFFSRCVRQAGVEPDPDRSENGKVGGACFRSKHRVGSELRELAFKLLYKSENHGCEKASIPFSSCVRRPASSETDQHVVGVARPYSYASRPELKLRAPSSRD
jgi:hypothetical protein